MVVVWWSRAVHPSGLIPGEPVTVGTTFEEPLPLHKRHTELGYMDVI